MAATNTASSGQPGPDLHADAPRAQSLIADAAQVATKPATDSAATAASSLPATAEAAVPASVFDTAIQAGLIALPQDDAAISTLAAASSTTHAGGSEAAVTTVVTADNNNSNRIAGAGAITV